LLSGGISAIARIGHNVPFPSTNHGPNCDKAFAAMNSWSVHAGALNTILWIGCLGWLALMAGVVAWLRASGRGRCGWEPATLIVVACLLPVWMCVQSAFHPQDLLALGLALSALACAVRGRWIGAGILVALAVLSQQFALLVAAPLYVLAPAKGRLSYAGAAVTTAAVVVIPLMAVTSGRALRAITLGTGNNPSSGGTLLWELHHSGAIVVLISRVAPVMASIVLAWWVSREMSDAALKPDLVLSVVAVSLSLRLVFEQNLIGYYFMALAVSLVLIEVVRGRIRSSVVAWLAGMTVVICKIGLVPFAGATWGSFLQSDLPLIIAVLVLVVLVTRVLRVGADRGMWPWLAVAACALLVLWSNKITWLDQYHLTWFWQLVVVVPGVVLAAEPLLTGLRESRADLAEGMDNPLPSPR